VSDHEAPLPDDALVAELRGLIERADPVPPTVAEAAKAVLGWRSLDADLAELLTDSAVDSDALVGARGDPHVRAVAFASADVEVDLEVRRESGRLLLAGQVAPPAPATVELQADDGTATTVESDELGRFRADLAPVGRLRLRVSRPGALPVLTSWLSL
jgi:hypothetical protein